MLSTVPEMSGSEVSGAEGAQSESSASGYSERGAGALSGWRRWWDSRIRAGLRWVAKAGFNPAISFLKDF